MASISFVCQGSHGTRGDTVTWGARATPGHIVVQGKGVLVQY